MQRNGQTCLVEEFRVQCKLHRLCRLSHVRAPQNAVSLPTITCVPNASSPKGRKERKKWRIHPFLPSFAPLWRGWMDGCSEEEEEEEEEGEEGAEKTHVTDRLINSN